MTYYFNASEAMYNCGSIGFRHGNYAVTLRGELRNKYINDKPAAMAEIFNCAHKNLDCEVKILALPLLPLRINGLVEFDGNWNFNMLNCQISCESFCIPIGFRQYDFIDTNIFIIPSRAVLADIVNTGMPIYNAAIIETDIVSDAELALFPHVYGVITRNVAPNYYIDKLLFVQIKYQNLIYINTAHPFYTGTKNMNSDWDIKEGTFSNHGIDSHMNEPLIKNAYN